MTIFPDTNDATLQAVWHRAHSLSPPPPPSLYFSLSLLVRVAERPVNGAHQLADRVGLVSNDAEVGGVVEALGAAAAEHAGAALHLHHAVGVVLPLPDGPDAVDHGVVQPEGRLVGRDVEVSARVARHGEVPDPVDASAALHVVLEGLDRLVVLDLVHNVRRLAVPRAEVVGDVAPDAPRVGSVAVGLRVPGRGRPDYSGHGPEVDGHAFWGQTC